MAQLRCPKCGSTDVYCGGMNPVQCNARCRSCGFEVTGSIKIGRYFGGKASYATYVAEKEAEDAARKQALRDNEEACKRIAAQRASCSHSWERRIQDNYGYEYCPKCGATRPIGGGKWY